MKILKTEHNLDWLPKPNEAVVMATDEMPPAALCATAFVFAFEGESLLMADLSNRGIDIPGGHIEKGETPEDAMRREALEETGAIIGPARVFAVQKVTLKGMIPDNYAYPHPDSHQVFYFAPAFTPGPFKGDDDSRGPVLISPERAKSVPCLLKCWEIYECALNLARKNKNLNPVIAELRS